MEAVAYFNVPGKKSLNCVTNKNTTGRVMFIQEHIQDPVRVIVDLYGLPKNGYMGMHVHEKPLTRKALKKKHPCKECGSHFNGGIPIWSPDNPYGTPHGYHIGDLAFNILSQNGRSFEEFIDPKISLFPEEFNNIVGRSLVIHGKPDDKGLGNNEESLMTGNAGDRVGCSNIIYIH